LPCPGLASGPLSQPKMGRLGLNNRVLESY